MGNDVCATWVLNGKTFYSNTWYSILKVFRNLKIYDDSIGTNGTSQTTYRGCKARGFCQSMKQNNTKCSDCEKNKCNDATGVSSSIATMVVTAAGVLVFSRF